MRHEAHGREHSIDKHDTLHRGDGLRGRTDHAPDQVGYAHTCHRLEHRRVVVAHVLKDERTKPLYLYLYLWRHARSGGGGFGFGVGGEGRRGGGFGAGLGRGWLGRGWRTESEQHVETPEGGSERTRHKATARMLAAKWHAPERVVEQADALPA
jgi:hypothetical protein